MLKYLHAIKHLRFRQVLFLVRYRLFKFKNDPIKQKFRYTYTKKIKNIPLEYIKVERDSLTIFSKKFGSCMQPDFQNISSDYMYEFSFNYLDHLNTSSLVEKDKIKILKNYVNADYKSEWHPYTASRRLINIIIFLSQNLHALTKVEQSEVEKYSSAVYRFIGDNLEFHIDANHLLANYFALSLFENTFETQNRKYTKKYLNELDSQIIDGFHYERSLGYTISVIYDFMIFYQIQKNVDQSLISKLNEALKNIENLTKANFNFGDNVFDQVPPLVSLIKLGQTLFSLEQEKPEKSKISNFYILNKHNSFCVVVDGGTPMPEYQPGHAHDSTGAFILSYQGHPIVTNGGVSTYEKNKFRYLERSRYSYSKPINLGVSQEVWSGFRIAQRRSVKINHLDSEKLSMSINTDQGGWQKEIEMFEGEVSDTYRTYRKPIIAQYILSENVEVVDWSEHKIILLEKKSNTKFVILCFDGKALPVQSLLLGQKYGTKRNATILRFHNDSSKLSMKIGEL